MDVQDCEDEVNAHLESFLPEDSSIVAEVGYNESLMFHNDLDNFDKQKPEYSDEDNTLKNVYEDGSQLFIQTKQNESLMLRNELEKYLDDLQVKQGSDGESLIRVPLNFDSIAQSMNRGDLNATEDNPWSRYLLLDSLNNEADIEYDGRYNNVFNDSEEVRIQRGMAQIQLLDRQLKVVATKNLSRVPTAWEDTDQTVDNTFLTKSKVNGDNTARSTNSQVRDDLKSWPAISRSKSIRTTKGIKRSFSAEEEQRIAWLMENNESIYKEMLCCYIDENTTKELSNIDEKLAQYGRSFSRLGETGVEEVEAEEEELMLAMEDERKKEKDFLYQESVNRKISKYTSKIDQLLEQCSSSSKKQLPIQYEALLPPLLSPDQVKNTGNNIEVHSDGKNRSSSTITPDAPATVTASSLPVKFRQKVNNGSNSTSAAVMNRLPTLLTEINVSRVVTYQDIQKLISSITNTNAAAVSSASMKSSEGLSSPSASSPLSSSSSVLLSDCRTATTTTYVDNTNDNDDDGRKATYQKQSSSLLLTSDKFRQLLRTYRSDIEALKTLRARRTTIATAATTTTSTYDANKILNLRRRYQQQQFIDTDDDDDDDRDNVCNTATTDDDNNNEEKVYNEENICYPGSSGSSSCNKNENQQQHCKEDNNWPLSYNNMEKQGRKHNIAATGTIKGKNNYIATLVQNKNNPISSDNHNSYFELNIHETIPTPCSINMSHPAVMATCSSSSSSNTQHNNIGVNNQKYAPINRENATSFSSSSISERNHCLNSGASSKSVTNDVKNSNNEFQLLSPTHLQRKSHINNDNSGSHNNFVDEENKERIHRHDDKLLEIMKSSRSNCNNSNNVITTNMLLPVTVFQSQDTNSSNNNIYQNYQNTIMQQQKQSKISNEKSTAVISSSSVELHKKNKRQQQQEIAVAAANRNIINLQHTYAVGLVDSLEQATATTLSIAITNSEPALNFDIKQKQVPPDVLSLNIVQQKRINKANNILNKMGAKSMII